MWHIWKKASARSTLCCAALVLFPVIPSFPLCVWRFNVSRLLSWSGPPTQKTNRRTAGSPGLNTHTCRSSKVNLSQSSQNRTCCYGRWEITEPPTGRSKDNNWEGGSGAASVFVPGEPSCSCSGGSTFRFSLNCSAGELLCVCLSVNIGSLGVQPFL